MKVTFGNGECGFTWAISTGWGSQAKGVAVGLETSSGIALAINHGVYTQALYASNNNVLNLQAYVQGEPMALQNKSLVLGPWSATATFKLDYE